MTKRIRKQPKIENIAQGTLPGAPLKKKCLYLRPAAAADHSTTVHNANTTILSASSVALSIQPIIEDQSDFSGSEQNECNLHSTELD